MRIHLGSDHAGYELKQRLSGWLSARGHEVVDAGPEAYDAEDDYPPFVLRAAQAVAREPDTVGVVIGGSGNGEQIAANKVAGVRAALVWSAETARLAREHNDANVISLGARMHTPEQAEEMLATFLETAFSGQDRHVRRIDMITEYERHGWLPPLPAGSV